MQTSYHRGVGIVGGTTTTILTARSKSNLDGTGIAISQSSSFSSLSSHGGESGAASVTLNSNVDAEAFGCRGVGSGVDLVVGGGGMLLKKRRKSLSPEISTLSYHNTNNKTAGKVQWQRVTNVKGGKCSESVSITSITEVNQHVGLSSKLSFAYQHQSLNLPIKQQQKISHHVLTDKEKLLGTVGSEVEKKMYAMGSKKRNDNRETESNRGKRREQEQESTEDKGKPEESQQHCAAPEFKKQEHASLSSHNLMKSLGKGGKKSEATFPASIHHTSFPGASSNAPKLPSLLDTVYGSAPPRIPLVLFSQKSTLAKHGIGKLYFITLISSYCTLIIE